MARAKIAWYFDSMGFATKVVQPDRDPVVAPPSTTPDGMGWLWGGADWLLVNLPPEPAPFDADTYRTAQITAIRDATNKIVSTLKANAAKYEIDTWSTQYNDYVNWLRAPESPTPFTDNLAKTRGLTREELFKKIDNKVIAISTLQGIQHAFEDKLKAATTQSEMDSVVTEFNNSKPN
jgi:hypothetical protein